MKKIKTYRKTLRNVSQILAARARLFKVTNKTYDKKQLRLFYVRYADDWILLTNGGFVYYNKYYKKASQVIRLRTKDQ